MDLSKTISHTYVIFGYLISWRVSCLKPVNRTALRCFQPVLIRGRWYWDKVLPTFHDEFTAPPWLMRHVNNRANVCSVRARFDCWVYNLLEKSYLLVEAVVFIGGDGMLTSNSINSCHLIAAAAATRAVSYGESKARPLPLADEPRCTPYSPPTVHPAKVWNWRTRKATPDEILCKLQRDVCWAKFSKQQRTVVS